MSIARMTTVDDHYAGLLAPIYAWSVGGAEAALADGETELAPLLQSIRDDRAPIRAAIDLGAGFGKHAIPLARAGVRVTAIDSSAHLLAELRSRAGDLPIRTVHEDLRRFRQHVDAPADLVLCMGDTLPHLPDHASVERVLTDAAEVLAPDGRLVLTFRDHAVARSDEARIIAVRSDADRIHTCVLEERGDRILVHDIVHERAADAWPMRVSRYQKLRLSAAQVAAALGRAGLDARVDVAPGGMVRVTARRSA